MSRRGEAQVGARRWSGRDGDGPQPGERPGERLGPGPVTRQVERHPEGRAGEPADETEEPTSQGLGGDDARTEADPARPARHVVRHHLYRQPGAAGGEPARRQMGQGDALLDVADGVLDLGVPTVVGLELEGVAVTVGDEGAVVIERVRRASWEPGATLGGPAAVVLRHARCEGRSLAARCAPIQLLPHAESANDYSRRRACRTPAGRQDRDRTGQPRDFADGRPRLCCGPAP